MLSATPILFLNTQTAHADDSWGAVANGITWLHRTTSEPQDLHVVWVDLTFAETYIRATKEEERGQTVPAWASAVGATVAINGDWFSYDDYYPVGLAVGDGWGWTDRPDLVDWGYFACSLTKDCWLDYPGTLAGWSPRVHNAVGGNEAILVVDGVAWHYEDSFYSSDLAPRSAIGVSADGNTLILAVIDGRSSSAAGMTFNEVADLMVEMGAYDAMMLDGGGSSTLYISGYTVNNPSDGSPRVVSNHLGIMVNGAGTDPRCAGQENGKQCVSATMIGWCEGGLYEEGDCGVYGLTCEEDPSEASWAYCLDPRCTSGGQDYYCTDSTHIAGCVDGVYGEGDCAYYGAGCAEAYGDAWCAYTFYQGALVDSSFSQSSAGTVVLAPGEELTGWVDFQNTGLTAWTPGITKLAPVPRDTASALAASTWESTTRAATVTAAVAPGETGRFELTLRGSETGTVVQGFGLVEEGVTWFQDTPTGGGPLDGTFSVTVGPTPDTGGPSGTGGEDPAGEAAGEPGALQPYDGVAGCGCAVPARTLPGGAVLALVAALGGRRRRRSRLR